MAIRTTIATHYAWRCLIIAGVCLVLGVWGIYDYVQKIPSRIQAHERGDVAAAVRDAVSPGAEPEQVDEAHALLAEALQRFMEQYGRPEPGNVRPATNDEEAIALGREVREIVASLRREHQEPWARALVTFEAGLEAGWVPEGRVLDGPQLYAFEVANRTVERAAAIPRPRVYDRPVQWMFILCLPFVPYFLWEFYRQKTRVYRLDDDGTLHTPAGVWKQQDIRDIHMDTWMKKSIAYLEHTNGTRIKLDDYKQKKLHLIVGAIASRMYPEEWDGEARPAKKGQADGEEQVAPERDQDQAGVAG